MWFGTRYGLDQFDGHNFKVYFPGPSGDLMGGNYILDVLQDHRGDLWMTTYIDLVRWVRGTGDFIHYKNDPNNPDSLTAGRVNTIWEDPTGIIWVGTNDGLNRYDPAMETFSRFFEDRAVFRLYPVRQGGIWMGTDGGLWYYDSGSFDQQHPMRYQNDPTDPGSLSPAEIYAIYQDQQDDLWVGSLGGGLNRLERKGSGSYLPIMERMLQAGYATFAWDKPGSGESTGRLEDGSVQAQRTQILLDAIQVIRARPDIDPRKIGLWGISQAGYVMPHVLAQSKDVAFMICVSCAGMSGYDQMAFQVTA
jgi:ligand-binding sensor domain-containing protein